MRDYDCAGTVNGANGPPFGITPEYGIAITWNVPKYSVDCGFESDAAGNLAGDDVTAGSGGAAFCPGSSEFCPTF